MSHLLHRNALEIIQSSKEIDYRKHYDELSKLEYMLILRLFERSTMNGSPPNFQLLEYVLDLNQRADLLLANVDSIKSQDLASRLIRSILIHSNIGSLSPEMHEKLKNKLSNISVYGQVAAIASINNENDSYDWIAVMEQSVNAPQTILYLLIERREYQLCLRWTRIHTLQTNQVTDPKFIDCLTHALIVEQVKNKHLFEFIESLPTEVVLGLNSKILLKLKNRPLLEYLVTYLTMQGLNTSGKYQHYEIALRIIDGMELNLIILGLYCARTYCCDVTHYKGFSSSAYCNQSGRAKKKASLFRDITTQGTCAIETFCYI